eukprot:Opistho-2@13890
MWATAGSDKRPVSWDTASISTDVPVRDIFPTTESPRGTEKPGKSLDSFAGPLARTTLAPEMFNTAMAREKGRLWIGIGGHLVDGCPLLPSWTARDIPATTAAHHWCDEDAYSVGIRTGGPESAVDGESGIDKVDCGCCCAVVDWKANNIIQQAFWSSAKRSNTLGEDNGRDTAERHVGDLGHALKGCQHTIHARILAGIAASAVIERA